MGIQSLEALAFKRGSIHLDDKDLVEFENVLNVDLDADFKEMFGLEDQCI